MATKDLVEPGTQRNGQQITVGARQVGPRRAGIIEANFLSNHIKNIRRRLQLAAASPLCWPLWANVLWRWISSNETTLRYH